MRVAHVAGLVGSLLLSLAGTSAQAGVLFFTSPSAFAAATSGYVAMGIEDWSSGGNAGLSDVIEPLQPGIPAGIFPHGTNPTTGLSVQSNSHITGGANVAPGSGLVFAPAGFTGLSGNHQPSNQVSSNAAGASFDLLFAPVGGLTPTAVSLTPMFYRLGNTDSATLTVQVFDAANGLLGSTTVPNVVDVLEDAYLGIVTTDADTLGRINVWANAVDTTGADNIAVYAAPETPSAASALLAIATLAVARGRAGSRLRSWITSDGASVCTAGGVAGA